MNYLFISNKGIHFFSDFALLYHMLFLPRSVNSEPLYVDTCALNFDYYTIKMHWG